MTTQKCSSNTRNGRATYKSLSDHDYTIRKSVSYKHNNTNYGTTTLLRILSSMKDAPSNVHISHSSKKAYVVEKDKNSKTVVTLDNSLGLTPYQPICTSKIIRAPIDNSKGDTESNDKSKFNPCTIHRIAAGSKDQNCKDIGKQTAQCIGIKSTAQLPKETVILTGLHRRAENQPKARPTQKNDNDMNVSVPLPNHLVIQSGLEKTLDLTEFRAISPELCDGDEVAESADDTKEATDIGDDNANNNNNNGGNSCDTAESLQESPSCPSISGETEADVLNYSFDSSCSFSDICHSQTDDGLEAAAETLDNIQLQIFSKEKNNLGVNSCRGCASPGHAPGHVYPICNSPTKYFNHTGKRCPPWYNYMAGTRQYYMMQNYRNYMLRLQRQREKRPQQHFAKTCRPSQHGWHGPPNVQVTSHVPHDVQYTPDALNMLQDRSLYVWQLVDNLTLSRIADL